MNIRDLLLEEGTQGFSARMYCFATLVQGKPKQLHIANGGTEAAYFAVKKFPTMQIPWFQEEEMQNMLTFLTAGPIS